MRVIQVTDIHLPPEPGAPVRGRPADALFLYLLDHLRSEPADLVLLTGDLYEDAPEPGATTRLLEAMAALGKPWRVVRGNHDVGHAGCLDAFGPALSAGFEALAGGAVALLDSAEAEEPPALGELARHLRGRTAPTAVFTHHPPVDVGCEIFDTAYRLPWREALLEALRGAPAPVSVFYGHIHCEHHWREGGLRAYGTPSATLPRLPHPTEFVPDGGGPHYRVVEPGPAGVATRVVRLPPLEMK